MGDRKKESNTSFTFWAAWQLDTVAG